MNHDAVTHAVVIPYSSLLVQAFNVVFLIGLLVYLLRDKLAAHFAKRAADYRALVTKAESLRVEAERAKRKVQDRLAKLDADARAGTGSASTEGAALRATMIADAKEAAVKIDREAEWSARAVVEKATAKLRRDLLDRALASAGQDLRTSLGSNEQTQLRREFADKIQVVGQ